MSEPARVFVVDDDQGMRDSLRFLLEAAGFAVETYASGPAFLEAGGAEKSGCLVTDVRMPDMNGLELHGKLMATGHQIPTIFVTAFPDRRVRDRALRAGGICFLSKPFARDDLLGCIQSALKQTM